MKETNKTLEISPFPLNNPKTDNFDRYQGINPFIHHLQRSNLSLVFSSPLIHKEKNKKISQDNVQSLSSKFGPLALSGQVEGENKENFNIFTEKETLKKIFSNQLEKQRKNNNYLDNYLGYNSKLPYFEDLIFASAPCLGVKDKVQISNSLTTLPLGRPGHYSPFPLQRQGEGGEGNNENFKKDYYQLILNINNYLFIISKFVRTFNSKFPILKSTLFMPKRFLTRQPDVKYEIRLRSVKKTLVQKVIPRSNLETVTLKKQKSTAKTNKLSYGENLKFLKTAEKAVELKSQSNRNKKLLLLEKKLITNLLKQGIKLILYLNILINQKQTNIKSLINLQNFNNLEPTLLEKISNIFSPPLLAPAFAGEKGSSGRVGPRVETKKFKSKLELELNRLEWAPSPSTEGGEAGDKSSKNEIFLPTFSSPLASLRGTADVQDNLEFDTPELTNLPFSLLFYKNKNNISYPPYPGQAQAKDFNNNNNLQLKTIPFSLLLNKNTVLEGKNAVKLSIVNSHFDLDKNNTRDTVQTSALSSTASLSLGRGAETENSVHKPVISQYLKELSIYNIRNKGIIIFYYILIGFHFNTDLNKSFTSGKKTKNINKLLAASFKSMYCLISKPVFITTPDKIIVQLFYYLFIPNVLKLKKFFKYKDKDNENKVINTYFNREPIVKSNENVNAFPADPLVGPELVGQGFEDQGLKSSKSQILATSKLRKKQKEISLRKKIFRKQYNKFRKIKINVRVKLRKLSNVSLVKVFPNKFKFLSLILNNIFKKPVVFDLVRLHYPYNDSNILVNLLGIMINKIKLRIIIRRFFEKAIIKNINKLKETRGIIIPSFLSGLTIRVAGRLLTHKVVPRLTVKTTSRGASASGRINFKDIATYTNKNKRGAYSITVKAGQNLF
uniref:Small ribosomal subunit protein uS3m n=1 Tax=Termitomyces sp. TaxID=1916073 RepID=A0A386TZ81_9AGAR|nr:ribosomal protein S3 [Termitomyces sp.]